MLASLFANLATACTLPANADPAGGGERSRAAAAAATIEEHWPLAGSGPELEAVREVGARLARTAPARATRWRFTVIRDRSLNAFAIGDGRIYVHEGAVTHTRSRDELAAVVAHEMGHQLAGHFRDAPPSGERRVGHVVRSFDLPRELEADRISLRLLGAAGFDPRAALSVASRAAEPSSGGASHFGDQQRLEALQALLEAEGAAPDPH